jgi:hypothetical protein
MITSLGPGPCASCSWNSASNLFLTHQGFGNTFSAFTGLRSRWVDLHWLPKTFFPSGFPYICAFPSVILSLGCVFAGLDTPGPLPPQVRSSRPQAGPDCHSRDFATHKARSVLGTKPPAGYRKIMPPMPTPNQYYLIPGALPPGPFPRMLASLEPGPHRLLFQGFAPWATSLLSWPPDLNAPVFPPSWLQI